MRGRAVFEECRRALAEDASGAIVLGCAGMAELAASLTRELQVPVIDGVAAAVKIAEALVGLGLKTSKHGDLASPLRKRVCGRLGAYCAGVTACSPDGAQRNPGSPLRSHVVPGLRDRSRSLHPGYDPSNGGSRFFVHPVARS